MTSESQEIAVLRAKRRRMINVTVPTSKSIAKAIVGTFPSSSREIPGVSLRQRRLSTINETCSFEQSHRLALKDHFHAPSVAGSIDETKCSANPPSIPMRQYSSIRFPTDNKKKKSQDQNKSKHIPQQIVRPVHVVLLFDRFTDDTIPCDKAPPSKPKKRTSIDSGLCESMASTISLMSMDASMDASMESSLESFNDDTLCLDVDDESSVVHLAWNL